MSDIAIVEDEPNLRELLGDLLGAEGHAVRAFATVQAAERALASWAPDVLVLDVKLPDGDGLQLLERLRKQGLRAPAVVTTAFGTVDRAVQALRAGAADFLVKPVDNARLKAAVARALLDGQRLEEVAIAAGGAELRTMIGSEGGLRDVAALVERVAMSEATVLIHGESGTGKELVARAIHAGSARKDGPFVSLNCASLPANLVESELFGYERGAFTGAHAERKGLVEAAEGGTLFLDEMGDLPLDAQAKLLRVLQERELMRVGGRAVIKVDVRVVAATHRDLGRMVKEGSFRQDLLYRLEVVPIELPPLRARRQDLPLLFDHFLEKHEARHKRRGPRPTPELLAWAARYPWPGNVRELENLVERAVVLGAFAPPSEPARAAAAPEPPPEPVAADAPPPTIRTLREAVVAAEREAVIAALVACRGNKAQAARALGVSYKTLFNKIHEHDIKEAHEFG